MEPKWRAPRRSAASPGAACRIPERYRHVTPYPSIIRPFFERDCTECWRQFDLTDSRPPPSDDIGRKRESPMNSTPTSKAIEPQDALIARADERLAHAYQQIARADEELTRVSEQVAKMERDAAHPRLAEPRPQSPDSAGPGPQSPPGRPALRAVVGLVLAAGIVVAALVWQSSYGGGAKLVIARWAPQLVSTPSLPPENLPLPVQPAPPTVKVAAAEAAAPQSTRLAQTTPQDAAPTATAALPDHTQLLETMARALANVERSIEQLKASQQQTASDNSKAIEELKANQEEIKRVLARVSEQNLPKTSSPPAQPMPTLRKPERTLQSPYVRARPRIPREWFYDDW
jgi:uncharacterized membrane protein YccC